MIKSHRGSIPLVFAALLWALATYVAVFYGHPDRGSLCDRSSDGYSAGACSGATEDRNVVLVTGLAGLGLGIFGLIRRYPPAAAAD